MGFLPRKSSYDEDLARRVREALGSRPGLLEKRMFGGLAFMLDGHMCCGVIGSDLMVRVGDAAFEDALRQPGARPMDFTGRPLRGMVYVNRTGYGDPASLARWVERGAAHASSLPPK